MTPPEQIKAGCDALRHMAEGLYATKPQQVADNRTRWLVELAEIEEKSAYLYRVMRAHQRMIEDRRLFPVDGPAE